MILLGRLVDSTKQFSTLNKVCLWTQYLFDGTNIFSSIIHIFVKAIKLFSLSNNMVLLKDNFYFVYMLGS